VPSRSRIEKYKALEEEIESLAEEINLTWASEGWRPIILIKEMVPHSRLVALHRLADFCLVTSLHDGMNLVSKEYVASRVDGDGALILSEFAGASRELTDAILVNPFSEADIAEAIRQALEMPEEERRRRMYRMRAAVEENNIYRWAGKIISALLKFEFSSYSSNTQADVSTLVAGRAR
jgi:trehalose 6-phosphate synthase